MRSLKLIYIYIYIYIYICGMLDTLDCPVRICVLSMIICILRKRVCRYFVFLFFVFSTGLVRLHITSLPLRSCQTIGAPSVQGSAQCPIFRFWQQQDSNPRPGDYHADVLLLRHFDPPNGLNPREFRTPYGKS